MNFITLLKNLLWGQAVDYLNENFQKVWTELTKLNAKLVKNKGYYTTEAALIAAYPSPAIGDLAYVGTTYPGVVYDCVVAGTWHNTEEVPDVPVVDLVSYQTIAAAEADAILAYRELGACVTSTTPAIYTLKDRVQYDFDAPVGNSVLTNFGGLTISSVTTPSRYKIKWNGTAWSAILQTTLTSGSVAYAGVQMRGVAGGTAQAITLTVPATIGALTAGMRFSFRPYANNTAAAPTLNVNSKGPIAILRGVNASSSTALVANDIVSTIDSIVEYDGTNFRLLNPQSGSIVQTTGQSTTDLMSQKAVSDELAGLELKVDDIHGIDVSDTRLFPFVETTYKVFDSLNIHAGQKYNITISASFQWVSLGIYTQNGWTNTDYHENIVNGQQYEFTAEDEITEINVFLISSLSFGNITSHLLVAGLIDAKIGTDKIVDYAITENKISAKAVSTEKLSDESVTLDKIEFKTAIVSSNRLDPSACSLGYVNKNTGVVVTATTRYVSDYIEASVNGLYCYGENGYGSVGYNAVYDENKQYIRGFMGAIYVYQIGDAYVRWTLSTTVVDGLSAYIIEGQTAGIYAPYFPTRYILNNVGLPQSMPAMSLCGSKNGKVVSKTITAGSSLQMSSFPQFLKANGVVSFSCSLNSFETISVGFGTSANSILIKVDATNIYIIKSGSQLGSTIPHELTISDFLCLTYNNDFFYPKVVISTKSGLFVHDLAEFASLESYGYPIAIMGANTSVTNAELRATSDSFVKPIWVVGDSYTSLYDERWTKQMVKAIGVDKFLILGLAGGSSSGMFIDLLKALNHGTPRFLIWCLGMNDTYSSWMAQLAKLEILCEQNGIELILQTIPIPSITTKQEQKDINIFIKSSSYRYIDVAAAMSPDSSETWYEGYNGDNVHPTVLGSKVIAARFLSDFPEFLQ